MPRKRDNSLAEVALATVAGIRMAFGKASCQGLVEHLLANLEKTAENHIDGIAPARRSKGRKKQTVDSSSGSGSIRNDQPPF
jgi:hypothetical protein